MAKNGGGGNSHQRAVRKDPKPVGKTKVSENISTEEVLNRPLNFADSLTIIGILVGVLLVILIPNLIAKIGLLFCVCGGCILLASRSHWTHAWPNAAKYSLGIVGVILLLIVGFSQFVHQWEQEHNSTSSAQVSSQVEHSKMAFLPPETVIDHPLLPFHEGQMPRVNVRFRNAGSYDIDSSDLGGLIEVVPIDTQQSAFDTFQGAIHDIYATALLVAHDPFSPYHYRTVVGAPLTKDEADDLNGSKRMLCIIAKTVWRDKSGQYQTNFCECGAVETPGTISWHDEPQSNHERKLP